MKSLGYLLIALGFLSGALAAVHDREAVPLKWYLGALVVGAVLLVAGCGTHVGTRATSQGAAVKTADPVAEVKILQKSCAVTGGAIDKKCSTDHEGRRIDFCCPMCREKFDNDPEKHLAKPGEEASAEPEEPVAEVEIAQESCPVMGGAIDKKYFIDHGGRRIYFCCPGCSDQFEKDPERYLAKLDEELKNAL